MEQDVWYFVVLGAVSVVLSQHAEVINDTKVLIDDVFFCCSSIFCCYDVQLLR